MSRSKKTPTEIVFYEPKNDAEFYKLCSGGISFPGRIAQRICDHYAKQK